ncbi:MAG: hypothetical protein K2J90_11845 [Lachnospiraceae bacterium]|nr:hypothetical protein [Lachnospiraceae bacterium]
MKLYKKKIKDYKNFIQTEYIQDTSIQNVMKQCQNVISRQENFQTSYFEFLYEQSRFIKKRWWGLQGAVLTVLWLLLQNLDAGNRERIAGVLATAFALLIIPEIWKNRRFSAIEIEEAAFYSLRQICAARILLFAVVDLILVTVFFVITLNTIQISAYEIIINFLIPLNVSCCICFRLLCSQKFETEYAVVLVCAIWTGLWLAVLTHDTIYYMIAEPIWLVLVGLSFIYLFFCIEKSQHYCEIIMEDTINGIKT